jgi:hypothetical protein
MKKGDDVKRVNGGEKMQVRMKFFGLALCKTKSGELKLFATNDLKPNQGHIGVIGVFGQQSPADPWFFTP